MADVLYIVGYGSLYQNEELKYSLRSLAKYGRNFGRVFITGRCPPFINRDKVSFLPELDIGKPMINHWWKVSQAFSKTDISDKAILFYDDIFLCRPVDLSNYPWYYRGDLPHDKPHGEYGRCLYNARLWLEDNLYSAKNFECHNPCIYYRPAFLKMSPIYEGLKLCETPPAVRSIYANRFINNGRFREDLKIRAFVKDLKSVVIGKRDCFSIADDCLQGPVMDYLTAEFPHKSEWEL